ncbi:MAG: hypothetical protein EBT03_11455 [Betaproteobacteria bacterium]|nr:hypothetical protein [Betaproteobacteria bacterium]
MTLHELIQKIGPTTFDELVYQVDKHDLELEPNQLLDALRFLEGQGLVKCELRVVPIERIVGTP